MSLIKQMLPGIQAMGHPVPDSNSGRGTKSRDWRRPGHLMSPIRDWQSNPILQTLRSSTEKPALPSTSGHTAWPPPPLPAASRAPVCTIHSCPKTPGSSILALSLHLRTPALCLYSSLTPKCPPLTFSELARKTQKV